MPGCSGTDRNARRLTVSAQVVGEKGAIVLITNSLAEDLRELIGELVGWMTSSASGSGLEARRCS
jgi:hypothetical protein